MLGSGVMEIGGHVQRLSPLRKRIGLILLQGHAVSSKWYVDGIWVSEPYSTSRRDEQYKLHKGMYGVGCEASKRYVSATMERTKYSRAEIASDGSPSGRVNTFIKFQLNEPSRKHDSTQV
jgi:hypothetical protein